MKTEKPIIIAGAGPAGLCAAINLAKAGYKVVVYEKNPDVGFQHQGQIQAIENVFYNIDTMEWLQGLNIERNFYYRPINDISFFSYDFKKYDFNSKFPLVYLIQRGNKENSLDYSFKKQAVDLGVKFQFNSEIQSSEADVVATGPPRPTYMASGINFKTDLSDLVWLIFDSNLSPKGYCYFLVCNGQATIASFIKCNFKDSRKYLGKTVDALEKLFNLVIENADYFTGFGYFDINYNFSKIVIGEAAGFQEYLFGFGTKYAMHSGYLASKSINDIKKYKNLIKDEIYPLQKISVVNRFLFEKCGDGGNKWRLERWKKLEQRRQLKYKEFLKSPKILHDLLFPFLQVKHLFLGGY